MLTIKFLIISIIFCFVGCSKPDSESQLLHKKNPIGSYGESVSDNVIYQIDDLLGSAQNNIGNKVILKGLIKEVCPMRGCWMEVLAKDTGSSIRIKVTDGEIVFPLSAKGKNVIAEGILTKLEFNEKQAIDWKVHLAKEKGINLDPNNVVLSDEDYYEFRLNCTGALIN